MEIIVKEGKLYLKECDNKDQLIIKCDNEITDLDASLNIDFDKGESVEAMIKNLSYEEIYSVVS